MRIPSRSHRPDGFGPVLASKWPVAKRRRLGILAMGSLFCATVLACIVWLGLAWDWGTAILVATYAVVTWMASRTVVRAGEGWLARGRKYVQTDRLTLLRAEGTLTGVRITMRDADSRHLRVRPSEISGNPDVWQLTRAGVLASRPAGLTVDDPTSHYFALIGK